MPRKERSFAPLISLAVFIVLEIASLSLLSSSSTLQNVWINRASHRIIAAFWGGGENIRNYFSLDEQNQQLTNENIELRRQLMQIKQAGEQAEALKNSVKERSGFMYIPATIVKMSRNTQRNYIVLDRGSEDGVCPEDGIITSSGVIGMVEAVDKHYSYGLTLMNINMKVSARVSHTGMTGPLSWDGNSTDKAFLHELPLHYEVSRGDTILTSGYSSIFPPGIPLGLAGSSKIVDGSTRDLEVFLFQNLSTVHYVTIVHNTGQEEIKKLEEEENKKDEK